MKKIFIILAFSCFFLPAQAQVGYAYRVGFTDKIGSLTYADSLQFLSPKALQRRANQGISLNVTDLPLVGNYVDSVMIVANAVKLHNKSKWLNQIVVVTYDSLKRVDILNLPFVNRVELVARYNSYSPKTNEQPLGISAQKFPVVEPWPSNKTAGDPAYYGVAYQQIDLMEGDYLHDQGFWGENMTIAVLDAGFKGANTHVPFDSVNASGRILSTYNFVTDSTYIYNVNYDHGMNVFGCIAAEQPGTYVGTAPKANFHLYLTEDIASEKPIEEDNWISGAEMADSAGADIINSSLGYTDFVDPTYAYDYATQFNGHTTMISRAANIASDKGMFVAVAQGNAGATAWHWMYTPADADSVYSVGMVTGSGDWGNSSYGPNSDGQVKPDGMAMGRGAKLIGGNGLPGVSNGSSFACPMLAGSAACLWQAFPALKEGELRQLIQQVSDRYTAPNNTNGYGIPNFKLAFNVALGVDEFEQSEQILNLYPNPSSGAFSIRMKQAMLPYDLTLTDMNGRVIFRENNIRSLNYHNSALQGIMPGLYILNAQHQEEVVKSKLLIK